MAQNVLRMNVGEVPRYDVLDHSQANERPLQKMADLYTAMYALFGKGHDGVRKKENPLDTKETEPLKLYRTDNTTDDGENEKKDTKQSTARALPEGDYRGPNTGSSVINLNSNPSDKMSWGDELNLYATSNNEQPNDNWDDFQQNNKVGGEGGWNRSYIPKQDEVNALFESTEGNSYPSGLVWGTTYVE